MDIEILKFRHPFTSLVAGTTSSGKTVFTRKLLTDWDYLIANIDEPLPKVMWCHGKVQDLHKDPLENVKPFYFDGLPNMEDIEEINPHFLVIDDLMNESKNDINLVNLFTKDSHHSGISVIFIVQNIFHTGIREISLNSHYLTVMGSLRLTQQVGIIGDQVFPGKRNTVIDIYKRATRGQYGYLLFDLHPQSDPRFALRSRIFKDELPQNIRHLYNTAPIVYEIY